MNTRWAQAAIAHAAEQGADVILHLGDFGYTFEDAFVEGLQRALADAGLVLLFVDGNHEAFPTLRRFPVRDNGLRQIAERLWHLPRGFRWTWGDVRFVAVGGAASVDRPWRVAGRSWWAEEEITADDVAAAAAGGAADVLVSHDCPAGVAIPGIMEGISLWPPDELARAWAHRQRLREVTDLVRPRAIWHGHYHCSYSTMAELGYGSVMVRGVNCDDTSFTDNVVISPLAAVLDGGTDRPV
jgi:Calcineurin-like phosphoesterase